MAWRRWRWIVDRLIRRQAADRELNEEIQAHLSIDAQQRIAAGDSPDDAWTAARRDFGNELLVKAVTREVWGFTSFERLWQDLRYAVRSLRRSPGFVVVASAALALGIGATTAIFSVVYSVLLRPLPFPDPDRLVMLWERQPTGRQNVTSMSNFRAWQDRAQSFEAAARAIFGDAQSLGMPLKVSWNDAREVEIVGIVSDIRHGQLHTRPDPCLFMPNAQQPFPFSALVIRTNGDPHGLVEAVKREIRSVDPDQGVGEIQTMEQIVSDSIARPRAQTLLFGVFGALALALACVGIYGVLAYAVTHRTREIGVRLALGATPAAAFGLILRDGLRLTASGLIVGLGAAVVLTRFMQGLLYDVAALDPTVFASVTILLTLVATAACALPAARATRVDPAIVLRDE
jgi:hypothetical protein